MLGANEALIITKHVDYEGHCQVLAMMKNSKAKKSISILRQNKQETHLKSLFFLSPRTWFPHKMRVIRMTFFANVSGFLTRNRLFNQKKGGYH